MSDSMKDKPTARNEREEDHVNGARAPGAFAKMKKGLVEGLAVLGMCGLLAGKAACTYEVPGVEPIDVADSGRPDASQDQDSGNDAGNEQDGGMPDAATDAGHDAGEGGMDAGHDGGDLDAGHDAGEGGMDAGYDGGEAGMDAGHDAGTDAGYDAGEGGMDAGVDSGTDAGVDGGAPDAGIVCGSTTTGSFSGFITTSVSQTIGGYTVHYNGIDGSGNALVTINCAEGTFETDYPCPVSIETDIARPSDGTAPAGRTIRITPSSANVTSAGVSINVTHP